jgi:hypothetical protein
LRASLGGERGKAGFCAGLPQRAGPGKNFFGFCDGSAVGLRFFYASGSTGLPQDKGKMK